MQITISGDCQMYIYLKDRSKRKTHVESMSDVRCNLLYDISDNFIGLRVLNKRSDTGETIQLPLLGEIDLPIHNAVVTENDNEILILFDAKAIVNEEVEDECVIDLYESLLFGIEPMPFTDIRNKNIIQPFIIRDTPLTFRS